MSKATLPLWVNGHIHSPESPPKQVRMRRFCRNTHPKDTWQRRLVCQLEPTREGLGGAAKGRRAIHREMGKPVFAPSVRVC